MLANIRNFSKTIWAKIIMGFIIIAFATWGMGGMFSGGNTNQIAKVNKTQIYVDDLLNYLRDMNISEEIIKKNLDKNVLEQILSQLISQKILEEEMQDYNISLSDKTLYEKIKKDERFYDSNNNFSRTEYEKYMLINNTSAVDFEQAFKSKEKVTTLFDYISGGTTSPYFLTNNVFKNQTKEIDIEYINLENVYEDNMQITDVDIKSYLSKNNELLKKKVIDFRYIKIDPLNITGDEEYSQKFFDKIDDIENKISDGFSFDDISKELNLKINTKSNFNIQDDENKNSNFDYEIYNDEEINRPKLIEKNELFVLYVIENIKKKDPDLKSNKVKKSIEFLIKQEFRVDYNRNLIDKISNNNFGESDFYKIVNNDKSIISIKKINSKNNNSIFDKNSLDILFSLKKNKFAILTSKDGNIYLTYIRNIKKKDLNKNSNTYDKFDKTSILELQSSFYDTYDTFLSKKYKIKINQQSLDKVKNLFE